MAESSRWTELKRKLEEEESWVEELAMSWRMRGIFAEGHSWRWDNWMTPPAAVWSRRVGHCGIRLSLGIDTGDPENYGRTIRMLEKLVRSALCQPVIAAIVLGKSDPCWSLHHITRR